jgi:N-acetylglucosaminyl-diphospho-decaprenol L-rhamnosyltransferase
MPDADAPLLTAEVVAVVVTMARSPGVDRAIASARAAAGGRDIGVLCVVNDPAVTGTWTEDGVAYLGAGLNLGWAAGMHAGVAAVACDYVWAVQDDLTLLPGALDPLVRALEDDPGLATVRPLRVDADDIVQPGSQGWYVGADANGADAVPAVPTPAREYADDRSGSFLMSSGQLIRRTAWEAVGGFDPWFYPWGFVDIDFGRTLTECGWRFRSVPGSLMRHDAGGSTTSHLRRYLYARNQSLFLQKWEDDTQPFDGAPPISPWIVEQARTTRARPRDVTLDHLRAVVATAATDIAPSMARWLPGDAARQAEASRALDRGRPVRWLHRRARPR